MKITLLGLTPAHPPARLGVAAAHTWIFAHLGFEPGLLDRTTLDPYTWSTLASPLRWLYAGALLSILPIATVIRHPIGKVLS